jgi:hypothetical protein
MNVDPAVLQQPTTPAAFRRLSWAFLWFVLDLRLGVDGLHLDLLPDVVGWGLSIAAFNQLRNFHPSVPRLSALAWIGAILSLPSVVTWGPSSPGVALLPDPILLTVWNCLETVVWILYVWLLLGVVVDVGAFLGRADLSARAHAVRVANLMLAVVLLSLWLGGSLLPGPLALFAMLAAIVTGLVLLVLIVRLLREAARAIEYWTRATRSGLRL